MTTPTQLEAARIDDIVTTWTEILAGRTDAIAYAPRLHDAVAVSGAWAWDDSGLWLTAGTVGAVILVPFDGDHGEIRGLGALLYAASTLAAAQPKAEAIENDDVGAVVIASGSTTSAPARIGWHAVTWDAPSPVALSNGTAILRVVSGAVGDRFAGGYLALGTP